MNGKIPGQPVDEFLLQRKVQDAKTRRDLKKAEFDDAEREYTELQAQLDDASSTDAPPPEE